MEKIRSLFEKYLPHLYDQVKALHVTIQDYKFRPLIRENIQQIVDKGTFPLFSIIEIETINRCNNSCSFCPVNKNAVQRPFKLMEESLFRSIINQLQSLDYSGALALYSNNEPLMDIRIIEFYKVARSSLPKAHLFMFTNATLLNIDLFTSLMEVLDELISRVPD